MTGCTMGYFFTVNNYKMSNTADVFVEVPPVREWFEVRSGWLLQNEAVTKCNQYPTQDNGPKLVSVICFHCRSSMGITSIDIEFSKHDILYKWVSPKEPSHLQAIKLPCATDIFEVSPRGSIQFRSVTDEAKNPMEEQTGAKIPNESGCSFSSVSNASLSFGSISQGPLPKK